MKAFRTPEKNRFRAGLILLIDGEVAAKSRLTSMARADILTRGFNPASRLPS